MPPHNGSESVDYTVSELTVQSNNVEKNKQLMFEQVRKISRLKRFLTRNQNVSKNNIKDTFHKKKLQESHLHGKASFGDLIRVTYQ